MDQVYTPKEVEAIFGSNIATYLKNKHRGGRNNQQGSDYESNFAILKLSGLCYQALTSKQDMHIDTQVLAFVDDLVITNRTLNSSDSYQIKDSKRITWDGGEHSIERDFKCHFELNKCKGIENINTFLTVSNKNQHDRLSRTIPQSIADHTECVLFENEPLNVQLAKESDIKQSLTKICSYAGIDKLTHLHTVMKGVWENNKGECTSVFDFIKKIHEVAPYNFLRSFEDNIVINSRFTKVLDQIDGLSYKVLENQLIYSYSCDKDAYCLDGIFQIDSPGFDIATETIIRQNPSTFIDLLRLKLL